MSANKQNPPTVARAESEAEPSVAGVNTKRKPPVKVATFAIVVVVLLLFLWLGSGGAASLITQGYSDGAPLQHRFYKAQVSDSKSFNRGGFKNYEDMNSFNGFQKQQAVKTDRPARTTWHADTGMDVPYKAFSNFTQSLATLNKGFEIVIVEERVAEGVELGDVRTLSTGSWSLLVPANNFTDYVRDLKALGRVLRFQTTSVSVEESSINVEMELKLASTNLKRLEAIAAEAKTIEEKLQVNTQIKDAEREVKKYEFANHGHEKSVEYSRVNLEVQELEPEKPSNDEHFIGNLLLALLLLFVSGLLLICCVLRPNSNLLASLHKMMWKGDRNNHGSYSSNPGTKSEGDHPEEVSLLVGLGTRSDSDGFNFVEKQ
jgi:hypothetical protein